MDLDYIVGHPRPTCKSQFAVPVAVLVRFLIIQCAFKWIKGHDSSRRTGVKAVDPRKLLARWTHAHAGRRHERAPKSWEMAFKGRVLSRWCVPDSPSLHWQDKARARSCSSAGRRGAEIIGEELLYIHTSMEDRAYRITTETGHKSML